MRVSSPAPGSKIGLCAKARFSCGRFDVHAMRRIDAHWTLLAARLSTFEACTLRSGLLLLVFAAAASVFMWDARGYPRFVGMAGLAVLGLCAASRGVRMYRAGVKASLPASVGRTRVRIHPARGFVVSSVVLGLLLPLAAAVGVLAVVDWAWLLVAAVVLIGGSGMLASRAGQDEILFCRSTDTAEAALQRLCMRADMAVPELVVLYDASANAWTSRGRVHVTDTLLELLDARELE